MNGFQFACTVSNAVGSAGSDAVTLTVVSLPEIVSQPESVTVAPGTAVSFTVEADGRDMSYQWYCLMPGSEEWAPLSASSATKPTLKLTAKPEHHGRRYRCEVSNAAGTVVSEAATLLIDLPMPEITTQPQSLSVNPGTAVTFTVAASGSYLHYQWYCLTPGSEEWTPVTDATATKPTLKLTAADELNGCQYRCEVSNVIGAVTSDAATLTVSSASVKPKITTQPESVTVPVGTSVTFFVAASGEDLHYQWYMREAGGTLKALSAVSAKKDTLKVVTKLEHDGRQYCCKVWNSAGSTYTKTVTLRVTEEKPRITTQPSSFSVTAGTTVTFHVVASGTNLKYQWYMREAGGTLKPLTAVSAKTDTLKVVTKKAHDGRQYCCKVWNSGGSTYTKTVTLSVS